MDEQKLQQIVFTYRGKVVAKPRMTQSDKWQKRPRVTQFWVFKANILQAALEAGFVPETSTILKLRFVAYIAIPASWSKKKRAERIGAIHDAKPDTSNILKGLEDTLAEDDSKIFAVAGEKYWDDDNGERVEIILDFLESQRVIKVKARTTTAKRKRGYGW